MWFTHLAITTSVALQACSMPDHVVSNNFSEDRHNIKNKPNTEYMHHCARTARAAHLEPSQLQNTPHTSGDTQRNPEPTVKTGVEYWSCNRPSIQDATPEERPTASPAVGRGAGLFVALGTSTRDLHRWGSQLAPKSLHDLIRTNVRSSEYC